MKTKPLPPAPKPTEKAIQDAVIRRLQAHDWIAVRVNSGAFKNEQGNYVRVYTIAGLNASAGLPDVIAFKSDFGGGVRCLLLEIKKATGTLTETQKRFHAYAAARGVVVYVIRDPAELDAILGPKKRLATPF